MFNVLFKGITAIEFNHFKKCAKWFFINKLSILNIY